jgi:hypothetical protein
MECSDRLRLPRVDISEAEEEADECGAQTQDRDGREQFLAKSAGEGTDVVRGICEVRVHRRVRRLKPVTGTRVGVGKFEKSG